MSKSLIIATISIGFLSYLGFGLYLYLSQDRLLFRPDLAPKEVELPKGVKRLFIDGIEVGVLDQGSDTTILYFGGNANNALEFFSIAKDFNKNVVVMNYPGYGRSAGKPSQSAIFEAALKVFDHFKNHHNILIGRSLGTAVASYIASKRDVEKIVLITPFHSITHIAKLRYPIYPISLILKHPFETYRFIDKTNAPIYVLLAQKDDTTPPATFKKLLPHLKNLKTTHTISGSTHADILSFEETRKWLKLILDR